MTDDTEATPIPAAAEAGPRFVWVDGELRTSSGAHLSVFDRGFQLGDGIFETLRARGGHVTELTEHVARLRSAADGLAIDLPADIEPRIAGGIDALLGAEGLDAPDADASIRVTVSRGTWSSRGLLPPASEHLSATIVIQAWPVTPPPPGHLDRGLSLVVSAIRRDPLNPIATLKTTSRADHIYARIEARRAGAEDAVFLTTQGYLAESTTANIFLIRRGTDGRAELATPALDCAILPGTTRSWLLRWAATVGLAPIEGRLTPDELAAADEAFLCSSVAGILPVTRFNGHSIGTGLPGRWTLRARADREAYIRAGQADDGRG
jgi:branched-chain amino acid aminotransferase